MFGLKNIAWKLRVKLLKAMEKELRLEYACRKPYRENKPALPLPKVRQLLKPPISPQKLPQTGTKQWGKGDLEKMEIRPAL